MSSGRGRDSITYVASGSTTSGFLDRIADHPIHSIDELLPRNIAASRSGGASSPTQQADRRQLQLMPTKVPTSTTPRTPRRRGLLRDVTFRPSGYVHASSQCGALCNCEQIGAGIRAILLSRSGEKSKRREIKKAGNQMLQTIAVVLILMWLLGLVTSYTMGGFIHVLLVLAVASVLIRLMQGRRVV